ncbi:MAG: exo-alpha-sialidase [Gemmatimonadetes bacterium]|nr:exo-alpha-sialidase [Gemmatimonadota bacterium]
MSAGSGAGSFTVQDIFDSANGIRIPKIEVAADGTILAFNHNCRQLRRSEDQGTSWGPIQQLEAGGNVVVDEATGDILLVRPRESALLRSDDSGRSWKLEEIDVQPNLAGHGAEGSCPAEGTCSESGVTLKHGEHNGRLLMPVRVQPPVASNDQEYWCYNYNPSLYSDDHGRSWQVGEPVQSGTGEGTLAELSDGRVYYNSRCHMAVDGKRLISWSHDGGHRWVDWQACETLREVGEPFYFKYGTKPSYGCNAGLVRLPLETTNGKDVLLFSTPDNPGGTRICMTVWASFDGARTWPVKRLVYPGPSAYSSLAADTLGNIYLTYERGLSANIKCDIDHHKISLATFNLDWVLSGS